MQNGSNKKRAGGIPALYGEKESNERPVKSEPVLLGVY
jgi:hypothetical protein